LTLRGTVQCAQTNRRSGTSKRRQARGCLRTRRKKRDHGPDRLFQLSKNRIYRRCRQPPRRRKGGGVYKREKFNGLSNRERASRSRATGQLDQKGRCGGQTALVGQVEVHEEVRGGKGGKRWIISRSQRAKKGGNRKDKGPRWHKPSNKAGAAKAEIENSP